MRRSGRPSSPARNATPAVTSWVQALDGITAAVYAVVALGFFILMLVPAMEDTATQAPAVLAVLGLYVLSQAFAIRDLAAEGRRRARCLPFVLTGSLAAMLIAFHGIPPVVDGSGWWPLNILFQLSLYLIGITYGSRLGWVATLATSAGVLLAIFVSTPLDVEEQLRLGLVEMVALAALLATADLWIRGLRSIAVESDRLDSERLAHLRSTSRAGREAERLRDVERYIHDEVLHALRAVAMERADLPGSQVRAWMQRLSHQLRPSAIRAEVREAAPSVNGDGAAATAVFPEVAAVEANAYSDLVERLHEIDLPLDIVWSTPRTAAMPTEVTEAIASATAEALRNVHRHAGVPTAYVTVRSTGTAVTVLIRDEGAGFDPRAPRLTRHGVARSVLGRMNDLGGTARVDSRPGEGTTVMLTWSPHVPKVGGREFPWQDETVKELLRRCAVVLIPSSVGAVLITLLTLGRYERPVLALGAAATIVLVLVFAPRFMLGRGLTGLESFVLTLLGMGIALAYGFAVPLEGGTRADFSALPFASLAPILILFTRPHWEGIMAWLAMTMSSSYVVYRHSSTVAEFASLWSVVITPGVAFAVGIVMRAAIDRFGSATYFAVDARRRAMGEAHRTSEVRASVVARLDQVNRAVRTFIDDVADGHLDVADPKVRARADELERAVREDLSLGPAPGVRRAIEMLRDSGATLDVRVPGNPPEAVDSEVLTLVETLVYATLTPPKPLDSSDPLARVFSDGVGSTQLGLTVTPRGEEWTIALLATTPSEEDASALAAQWRRVLADCGVRVMNIEGDVRARTVVPVPQGSDVAVSGRRDA